MSDPTAEAQSQDAEFTREQKLSAIAEVFGEEYANTFQDPVIFLNATFMSPTVKQFYRREFNLISRTLFVESVYRRRPMYNQDVLDDYAAATARKLSDIHQLLTTQCSRLVVICKSNGVKVDASYMHPEHRIVPIIAGHAKTYIATLYKLDELYQLVGSAVLHGVIDGKTRRQLEMLCRKAVRAFSAMLRNEILKLYKESQRMRKAMTAPDEEVDRAEAAHGQAVAEFDATVASELEQDPASHVDPAQASQVIDDLAAHTAAAKASRRRKTDETPVSNFSEPVLPAAA